MIMKEKNNGKELIKNKESKIKESGESNDNKKKRGKNNFSSRKIGKEER